MRIGLINEGTYPVTVGGGVSTWCDQLVRGLPEHTFALVTLTGAKPAVRWDLPANVGSTTLLPMWDTVAQVSSRRWRRHRADVSGALSDLWSSVLAPSRQGSSDVLAAAKALRWLSAARTTPLAGLLQRGGSTEPLLRAWAAKVAAGADLPELTLAEAAHAAALCDRMLAVMDRKWPEVDLVHAASNGPAALIGLARHWREGVPLVITEHGVYLRERYLALVDTDLSWASRYAVMTFLRTVSQVAYQAADSLAPVSDFNGRWERTLGADPTKIAPIHNGVDHTLYRPVQTDPGEPTISFVGRIDPLKDLHTLIEAFAAVRERVPARLRLFGPIPRGNEHYHQSLVDRIAELGCTDHVTFEGAVTSSRAAIEAGHVVALSSISEGFPFTVIESMMCGRATVSTDVGGVCEIVGRDGSAGRLVPPRDPRAMADALIELLGDDQLREQVAKAGRARALTNFTLKRCIGSYRALYDKTINPGTASQTARPVRERVLHVAA